MSQAKREGEWFVVGLFASAVALPYAVSYGSILLESKYSEYVVRSAIDVSAQYITKGKVDIKQTAINGLIPGTSYKNLLGNTANNFYNTGTDKDGLTTTDISQNTVKAIFGAFTMGIGGYADKVQSANQYGSWFNSYTDAVIGLGNNTMDVIIEKEVQ